MIISMRTDHKSVIIAVVSTPSTEMTCVNITFSPQRIGNRVCGIIKCGNIKYKFIHITMTIIKSPAIRHFLTHNLQCRGSVILCSSN